MLEIKDGYKLEFQALKTNRAIWQHRKIMDKTQNREKVQSTDVVEVVLVQCNLIDNQYQQKSEVLLYTFTPNKSYTDLLNVEPSNLVFLKTYNTEIGDVIRILKARILTARKYV